MNILKPILNLLGIGGEVLRAKSDLKVAEIEARAKLAQNSANWEASAAQNAATSWLDEFWTLVLAMPLVACFFPWCVPYIKQGFEALKDTPDWYVWGVLASISFAFARKALPSFSGRWKSNGA